MSEALTRDQLLAKCERKREPVEVEGFGTIYVQSLNDLEQSDVSAAMVGNEKAPDEEKGRRFFKARRMVAIKSIVDSEGNRMFADTDMPAVESLSPAVISAVYGKYLEMAGKGMAVEVEKQKKD